MSLMGIAIALHLIGVVFWIGGLSFVSLVLLPWLMRAAKTSDPQEMLERFRAIEHGFAPKVRIAHLIVGITGAWMFYRLNYIAVMGNPYYWWLYGMIGLWLIFFLLLFILGPSGVMKRIMAGPIKSDLHRRFKRMFIVHITLMIIGWVVIAGAAIGGHGY